MRRRLLTIVGLCLGVCLAATFAGSAYAQEKKPAGPAAKEDRIDGTIKSIDSKTKTISVRLRGKQTTTDVIYGDATKFTFRNKPATVDEVKADRNVICLGTMNEKGQLTATRVDVRDKS
jgi:hypothetical protein